ncbi:MAG: hypothetical protein Q9209_004464 [Squamulea sp. 1 TL-2023]
MHNPVDLDTDCLTAAGDVDVKKHIWAYKVSRKMWRRMPIFRGELATTHPRFPVGSKAAVIEKADGPVISDENSRIEYSAEDPKAINQRVREILSTTWHSLGTCKMAPREKMGAVDTNLNVHGVKALKAADLSFPPREFWCEYRQYCVSNRRKGGGHLHQGAGAQQQRQRTASS